jgi:hypothetical protein
VFAKDWAEVLIQENTLRRRADLEQKGIILGENIYSLRSNAHSLSISPTQPVDTWYNEKYKHDFSKEPMEYELDSGESLIHLNDMSIILDRFDGVSHIPVTVR